MHSCELAVWTLKYQKLFWFSSASSENTIGATVLAPDLILFFFFFFFLKKISHLNVFIFQPSCTPATRRTDKFTKCVF